jgi:hypothetical protein
MLFQTGRRRILLARRSKPHRRKFNEELLRQRKIFWRNADFIAGQSTAWLVPILNFRCAHIRHACTWLSLADSIWKRWPRFNCCQAETGPFTFRAATRRKNQCAANGFASAKFFQAADQLLSWSKWTA